MGVDIELLLLTSSFSFSTSIISDGDSDCGNAPGIDSSLSCREESLAGRVLGVRVMGASWERETRLGVVERSRRRALDRRAILVDTSRVDRKKGVSGEVRYAVFACQMQDETRRFDGWSFGHHQGSRSHLLIFDYLRIELRVPCRSLCQPTLFQRDVFPMMNRWSILR